MRNHNHLSSLIEFWPKISYQGDLPSHRFVTSRYPLGLSACMAVFIPSKIVINMSHFF